MTSRARVQPSSVELLGLVRQSRPLLMLLPLPASTCQLAMPAAKSPLVIRFPDGLPPPEPPLPAPPESRYPSRRHPRRRHPSRRSARAAAATGRRTRSGAGGRNLQLHPRRHRALLDQIGGGHRAEVGVPSIERVDGDVDLAGAPVERDPAEERRDDCPVDQIGREHLHHRRSRHGRDGDAEVGGPADVAWSELIVSASPVSPFEQAGVCKIAAASTAENNRGDLHAALGAHGADSTVVGSPRQPILRGCCSMCHEGQASRPPTVALQIVPVPAYPK